jgi:hypothetical protein
MILKQGQISAPKGQNIPARGNAPGTLVTSSQALKGRDKEFSSRANQQNPVLYRPSRAQDSLNFSSRGVAPGWHVWPFQGPNPNNDSTFLLPFVTAFQTAGLEKYPWEHFFHISAHASYPTLGFTPFLREIIFLVVLRNRSEYAPLSIANAS